MVFVPYQSNDFSRPAHPANKDKVTDKMFGECLALSKICKKENEMCSDDVNRIFAIPNHMSLSKTNYIHKRNVIGKNIGGIMVFV